MTPSVSSWRITFTNYCVFQNFRLLFSLVAHPVAHHIGCLSHLAKAMFCPHHAAAATSGLNALQPDPRWSNTSRCMRRFLRAFWI